MNKFFAVLGGLSVGTLGLAVGRISYAILDANKLTPDPVTSPKLRAFVSDMFLVAGAIPAAIVGSMIGGGIGSGKKEGLAVK